MIPDFEQLNERMEQASLKELMPDFDKEEEWGLLTERLQPQKKRRLIPVWSYAAAAVVLIAGGLWISRFVMHESSTQLVHEDTMRVKQEVTPTDNKAPTATIPEPEHNALASEQPPAKKEHDNEVAVQRKHVPANRNGNETKDYTTKDIIRNGTPCPIQICISQMMKCPNIQPAAISTCSTLAADESGQLSYKAHENIAKNCSLTVKEIEITSIATGETILLTANSTPSTAQEVFSYITGQKKGDILAGMFNSDCDHQTRKHSLRLGNSYGKLIIQ